MAYGYLKNMAKNDADVELYYDEGMYFEAFTMCIRNAQSSEELDEVWNQIEREASLKNTRLNDEDYESLSIEWINYEHDMRFEEEYNEWVNN